MEKINLKTYFAGKEDRYYNPKYLIIILEELLGTSFDTIKEKVNNAQVIVTEEEIKEFLKSSFEKENPELKMRIETRRNNKKLSSGPIQFNDDNLLTKKEIKESTKSFVDGLAAQRYYFEPYTLEYFKRYSRIVRDKALLLLSIIENMGNRNFSSIQTMLDDFDIVLDQRGNISKDDIIRIIEPTIHNIDTLSEKIGLANDLKTYLTFKMSHHSLLRDGITESEIYPTTSLQVKSIHYDHLKGNIPLSDRQKEVLREETKKSMQHFAKLLLN